ncbi:hypothetical protein NQ315_017019 [Exocentrus adspersus]|uniref:Cytochrome P450 n=1 Tax=Exocentrus adspersus TaxID=1586481 RepID=A0AAV8VAU4_9CUCU|nr:hypothetical protein NQ315_017019 [Exocentrus adspersus]
MDVDKIRFYPYDKQTILNYLYLTIFLGYTLYCYTYWKMKGVPSLNVKFPYLSPIFFLHGIPVVNHSDVRIYYREMKAKGYKYAGVCTSIRSVLIVRDLAMIKDVTAHNLVYFDDVGFHHTDLEGPRTGTICHLNGQNRREMREILHPKVLPRGLERLPQSVLDISAYLIEAMEDCALQKKDIDVKELMACFTADVISYHSYEINCYSYKRSREKFCTCSTDRVNLPRKRLHNVFLGQRNVENSLSKKIYRNTRNKIKCVEAGDYKNLDPFNLTIFLQKWSKDPDSNQDEPLKLFEMVPRLHIFFQLSFDSSATTLRFAIYELCRNPNIQEGVRDEINDVLRRRGGVITWDSLVNMRYLDQVIDETLRLYPPAPNLINRCVHNGYTLKGTDLKISSVYDILIPLFCLHRDPDYFPDPERFDPDRFDRNLKFKVPFFMPFGEGPREITSLQATMIQTKVGLVQILRKFRLSISAKTKLPLELKPQTYMNSKDVLYINVENV